MFGDQPQFQLIQFSLFFIPLLFRWAAADNSLYKQMKSSADRPHSVSITYFGVVGDGVTLNTKAFQNAIFYLYCFADKGGAQLFVPPGRWLTGSFSLISHLTLSLDKDSVIIGSKGSHNSDSSEWPIIDPLPSYGRGRELPGGRHQSLIHGNNLTDVIITDSSNNVCIEDCYISTGDDLIVIKSGWDEYGISFAHPCSNISIHRIVGETGSGAGIALGGEMSGGISEVEAKGIQLFNSKHGIRIKTSPGRGGYVRNIYISNVTMKDVDRAIRITGKYGEHPDENYDPKALPIINRIMIRDVTRVNISTAGVLEGIQGDSFSDICLSNVVLNVTSHHPWKCSFVEGYLDLVSPESCEPLKVVPNQSSVCHAADHLKLQISNGNHLMTPFLRLSSL